MNSRVVSPGIERAVLKSAPTIMKSVFLDYASLKPEELDVAPLLEVLPDLQLIPRTEADVVKTRIGDAGIVFTNKVVLDREALQAAKKLGLVCITATGTNNVDLEAASEQGIVVTNVRNYATRSVAEHVLMLMLALSRSLPAYRQSVEQGEWHTSEQFCLMHHPISELAGKTLGIIGNGTLGQGVVRLAECLGMRVLIGNRPGKTEVDADRVALDTLYKESDILSLHCPLSTETANLIHAGVFRQMKPTAYLINTARGGIVNEADLLAALNDGQIAGAAIDVLETEPPAGDSILLQYPMPNLIVTPHNAWASRNARQTLLEQLAAIVRAWQNGEIINRVN